jgi:AcrR family transcriptional regulator
MDFRRARSTADKRRRAEALVEAARSLALESGVSSVTLTAVAQRAGVHHSAMRRYFSSHKEVLLRLAAEGWSRWAGRTRDELRTRGRLTAAQLVDVLVEGLNADPLFCDLLAHVPLHLEHDVDIAHVREFKHVSHAAVMDLVDAVATALPELGAKGALDLVSSANALAATLWQVAHPPAPLAAAYAAEPEIAATAQMEFAPTLTRLLTASCIGLMAQP